MIGGYVVVRFTASEAMTQPRQCWRDVFAILKTRSSIERFAERPGRFTSRPAQLGTESTANVGKSPAFACSYPSN